MVGCAAMMEAASDFLTKLRRLSLGRDGSKFMLEWKRFASMIDTGGGGVPSTLL
jgi:hypothetical protein